MNFKKIVKVFLVTCLSFMATSCSTIFTGTKQRVFIDSNPQGAVILVNGQNEGLTPATVRLKRDVDDLMDDGKSIKLLLDGYREDYIMDANFNAVSVLNLFNLLFWGIDAATGAITRYDRVYTFQMIPSENRSDRLNGLSDDEKYERLSTLKDLLDSGAITQEEFEKEKAKLWDN